MYVHSSNISTIYYEELLFFSGSFIDNLVREMYFLVYSALGNLTMWSESVQRSNWKGGGGGRQRQIIGAYLNKCSDIISNIIFIRSILFNQKLSQFIAL